MSQLIGEYPCKLDSKGRLLVPSDLVQQLPGVKDDGLIALCGFEKQLNIYPIAEWNKKVKKLSKLSEYDEKSRTFLRLLTRGATPLKLDGAGRVLFPKQLLEYAGITNEMTLTCLFSRIEAWDTTTYNKMMNETPHNMAGLAQELSHIIEGGDDE
ncbi:MAG: division/cell wall cluster transcriptional repressor MraZ [Mucilaginibacter sp.]